MFFLVVCWPAASVEVQGVLDIVNTWKIIVYHCLSLWNRLPVRETMPAASGVKSPDYPKLLDICRVSEAASVV